MSYEGRVGQEHACKAKNGDFWIQHRYLGRQPCSRCDAPAPPARARTPIPPQGIVARIRQAIKGGFS